MACKRYDVTVQPGRPSGFIQYIQCDTLSLVSRAVSSNAPLLLTDVETVQTTVGVIVEELDGGGTGGSTPPPRPTTRYYEVVPCNNVNIARYTTRPPQALNERVSVTDRGGVPANVSWTYNGQTTTSPGTITSVFGTGRSGCSDAPPPPPPPPPAPSTTPITLGRTDLVNSAQACFRFNQGSLPTRTYYIDSDLFQNTTILTTDNTGFNTVPDGTYTNGQYYINVRGGRLERAVVCQNIPPPPPPDPIDPIELELTYYVIRSCEGGDGGGVNILRSTIRPPLVERERVVYQGQDYVYTGESSGRIQGSRAIPPAQLTGTRSSGCQTQPNYIQYSALRSCNNSNIVIYTTRVASYSSEQVEINGDTYYYSSPPTQRRPPSGSTIVNGRDIVSTGRVRCERESVGPPTPPPSGPGSPPPPPPPTTVRCTFREIVRPSLAQSFNSIFAGEEFTLGDFIAGEILLNGEPIGLGEATVTLTIGQRYVVEFRKPSHPYFQFSDGSPSRYVIESAGIGTNLVESIFTPTFNADTGRLRITTSYDPNIAGSTGNGEIFITGRGSVGKGSAEVELPPGDYTVYFGSISAPGLIFTTPEKRLVKVEIGKTATTNGFYTSVPLPTGYWLKPVDSIEKLQYNAVTTKGMFSNNIGNLTTFYSSSITASLDNHYTHVYHEPLTSLTSSIQFSLAYGNYYGSGSNDEGGQISDTPTRAIYGQYRNIILGNSNGKFNLSGQETDSIYVLSFQKDRRDTRADYNALEINLAHLSGSEFINGEGFMAAHTGSNVKLGGEGKVLRLISDYKINNNPIRTVPSAPIEYNIVSGSIEDGVYNSNSPHYYGKLYPSIGVAILDATKLDVSASFGTVTSREVDGKNQLKLFTAISGAAQYTDASGDYLGMKARATKEELVYHYLINVRNKEFNLSNNPTYYNADDGLIVDGFIDDPKTYITTIGLYDVNRNLIAVAKPSVAEFNSFTDEVMFNVKLKF